MIGPRCIHSVRTDLSGAVDDAHLLELWLGQRPSSTVRVYRPVVEDFLAKHPAGVRALTVSDVVTWADSLVGAEATRARWVATVKSFLSFAWRTGYTSVNVGRLLRCVKVTDTLHERIVDEEHMPAIVNAAQAGRDRTLVRLLYIAGIRISEAMRLRFVDVGAGRITVVGKGKRTRTLLVPTTLTDDLKALRTPQDGPQSPVFKSYRGKPLCTRNAHQIVTQAADEAGVTLSPHWLRHAHASHALDHGAPIHVVQRSLGHSNVATTSRYLHVRPNQGASQYLPQV